MRVAWFCNSIQTFAVSFVISSELMGATRLSSRKSKVTCVLRPQVTFELSRIYSNKGFSVITGDPVDYRLVGQDKLWLWIDWAILTKKIRQRRRPYSQQCE